MENEGFPHSPAPICCTFGEELKFGEGKENAVLGLVMY